MAEGDENLTEEQKQLYRKTRVPRKFCPNCGTRNEPDAMVCVNCGKDISWMKIPEPIPYDQAPLQAPKKMPEQQKIFTPRAILVLLLILALIAAFILILVFTTKGKSAELGAAPLAFGLVGLMFRGDRSSPSLSPHPCCNTGRNPRARRQALSAWCTDRRSTRIPRPR